MAIKFLNIRSKEVRVAETEPQISALWASSDHSPNITQGQDFGWRLAPEVVVQMRRIKEDFNLLLQIANRFKKNVDELNDPDILMHISMTTDAEHAPVATQEDYTDEYNEEIRRIERAKQEPADEAPSIDLTTPVTATTTTEAPTTTTTTTETPTTTTKKRGRSVQDAAIS